MIPAYAFFIASTYTKKPPDQLEQRPAAAAAAGYRERNFTWESAILEREIDWGEEGTGEKGELVVAGARGLWQLQ